MSSSCHFDEDESAEKLVHFGLQLLSIEYADAGTLSDTILLHTNIQGFRNTRTYRGQELQR